MLDDILVSEEVGREALLIGNEAIVRGAIEAGVAVVTGYPGTPASEIGDTFWRLAPTLGIRCEYSVNEKVALEVAAGAAQGGVRALVSFKHLGLNVAADPLPTLANSGVQAGMVIVTAGEPGAHTSPNEQDHRLLARMARLPMLDPATPEQARAMTALAFDMSEELGIPVLLRPTTRVSHTRGLVRLGPRAPIETTGALLRDPIRFVPLPPNARASMVKNEARLERAEQILADPRWSVRQGEGALGVVSTGVASCYVHDVLIELGAAESVTHLRLPSSFPLPRAPCRDLLERCDTILVVEELQPVIEEQLRSMAVALDAPPMILGALTGDLPRLGEYSPQALRPALARLLGLDPGRAAPAPIAPDVGVLPPRPPVLCPGCPHRASFAAVRLVFDEEDTAFVNDIGCYSLGFGKPLACADFLLCMGSSITQASGMSTAIAPKRTVAFIGDSTFFHSGMTGLLNAVACDHDVILVVLDNGTTAMTGHQPHPGIAEERGWPGPSASIEDVARGLGVRQLWTMDPFDVERAAEALREAQDAQGVRVVISRQPCPVDLKRAGRAVAGRPHRIDPAQCRHCVTKDAGMACSCESTRDLSTERVLRGLYNVAKGAHAIAPCTAACPLGVCVQGYTGLVAIRALDQAAALVRDRNPLPSICSRVCHAPCEDGCVQGDAVAINAVKRAAVEHGEVPAPERPERKREASVAVVGAGPAGLACADELARRGYPVTIYEAAEEPGGLLRYGIPPYRLPRDVLRRDIDAIVTDGVELRCGSALGRDLSLGSLLDAHDAVFLGIGAWIGAKPSLPGADRAGVTDALTFLGTAIRGEGEPLDGRQVVVIGGGDAAIDCARTAIRLQAAKVSVLYRRGREQMPAAEAEIADALDEGVVLETWARPVRFLGNETRGVTAVECLRTQPGDIGPDGRVVARDVAGSEIWLAADLVISAIGQRVDDASLEGDVVLKRREDGTILADPESGATSHPRVFAGGDVVTGPATVVDAMAAGRRAAWSIDVALSGGREVEPSPVPPRDLRDQAPRTTAPCAGCGEPRRAEPRRPARECREDFEEIVETLDLADAVAEAHRCLGCGPCASCDACLTLLGCPAIGRGPDGRPVIDELQCTGCGLCAVFCPAGAIAEVES